MQNQVTFTNAGNTQVINLENYNSKSLFPHYGIYLGEYKDFLDNSFPALLFLSQLNGICFLTTSDNREKIHTAMQNIIIRILLELPTGLSKLKMYDATGLGSNLIYLAQISEKIKGENILTEEDELKRMLQNIVSEIPSTIQKVLGHKYRDKTLIEYNQLAGDLAKAYHLVMITDYPQTFNNDSNQKLLKILDSGKKAGIFTFLSFNTEIELHKQKDINPIEVLSKIPCIFEKDGSFYVKGFPNDDYFNKKFKFFLNTTIPDNLEEIIDFVNSSTNQVKRIEVSLLDKLSDKNFWTSNSSNGIETPIGKTNFTDVKKFILSSEDGVSENPHHCLIGGATGSGKTVLLHNIICNTAWLYSPEDVQFILLDYKEGTEFKIYENLPHIKVLSIRSEREFGVSVLEYLDHEIEQRGQLFKAGNVSNIANFNDISDKKLPRIIVIIDEFQKLLDGETKIANYVSKSLDDIGRRGRSFGINLILSTQSLSGVNINQVLSHLGLRITLKLNTTRDCDQLLGYGNNLPFTFSKKGEAVYNSRSGLSEGNVRFQTAYIPTIKMLNLIDKINKKSISKYDKLSFRKFIHDGLLKPDPKNNKNYNNDVINDSICKVYIGDSVTLQNEHIFYKFRKQNESNVVIVGQDIESAISIFKHTFCQSKRQSSDRSEFYLFNKLNIDNEFYSSLTYQENVIVESGNKEIENYISELYEKLQNRINGTSCNGRIIIGFFDVYNIRGLRKNGMMKSALGNKLNDILIDGASYNMHSIIYSYSYQHLSSIIDTLKDINNFDTRIALKGGDSLKLFTVTSNYSIDDNGIGLIMSPFSKNNVKFKTYKV
ncbi:MAG: DNA translocase FtsK [Candidatus Delongbacteria bacterium]|nr:DNA translocase FtsK [Candidatus Delongbacteria bacterium]MBN2836807.1 DNA translocase FtsK [Candidatus Delongbacteria bacterium]